VPDEVTDVHEGPAQEQVKHTATSVSNRRP
jgi:hypothetical protein